MLRYVNIRRACAEGVSDHRPCAFDIDPYNLFEHLLKYFQLQPTQAAIAKQLFGTSAMDTNSSDNSSSSHCFLFEKCAGEAASLGASGHDGS